MKRIDMISFENKKVKIEIFKEPMWGYTVQFHNLVSGESKDITHEEELEALETFNFWLTEVTK